MSRALKVTLKNLVSRNKNARLIRKDYPDFPEVIPEPEEKSE